MLVSVIQEKLFLGPLGPTLGFQNDLPMVDPQKQNSIPVTELPTLICYKELFVHLNQSLLMSENRYNDFPNDTPVNYPRQYISLKILVKHVARQMPVESFSRWDPLGIYIFIRDAKNQLLPFA